MMSIVKNIIQFLIRLLVPCFVSVLQFIGPTSSVMAALGDKVSANILAQTAKVPSIPWSGQGIECELNEEVRLRSVLSVCMRLYTFLRWESGCYILQFLQGSNQHSLRGSS
jgi:hypothetical protein